MIDKSRTISRGDKKHILTHPYKPGSRGSGSSGSGSGDGGVVDNGTPIAGSDTPEIDNSNIQDMYMSELLGEVLTTCGQAQQDAAVSDYEMFSRAAFKDGKVAMISFIYQIDGKQYELSVPLFTVVPAQSLLIESIDLRMELEITSEIRSLKKSETKYSLPTDNRQFKVRYVPLSQGTTKTEQKTAQTDNQGLRVSIKAGQAEMPAGLAKVLQFVSAETIKMK